MTETLTTRYYKKSLWKISWVAVRTSVGIRDNGHCRFRLVKHYEHRNAVGQPWNHIRSIVTDTD